MLLSIIQLSRPLRKQLFPLRGSNDLSRLSLVIGRFQSILFFNFFQSWMAVANYVWCFKAKNVIVSRDMNLRGCVYTLQYYYCWTFQVETKSVTNSSKWKLLWLWLVFKNMPTCTGCWIQITNLELLKWEWNIIILLWKKILYLSCHVVLGNLQGVIIWLQMKCNKSFVKIVHKNQQLHLHATNSSTALCIWGGVFGTSRGLFTVVSPPALPDRKKLPWLAIPIKQP